MNAKTHLRKLSKLRNSAEVFCALDYQPDPSHPLSDYDPYTYLSGMADALDLPPINVHVAVRMTPLKLRGWKLRDDLDDAVLKAMPSEWLAELAERRDRINAERIAEGYDPI